MNFTEQQKEIAWNKASIVDGYNPDLYRKDACGAWIAKNKYGQQDNMFGWEVDHIFPADRGGDEHSDNLRAMQHQNNASKGNDYPTYNAVITAEGNKNIRHEQVFTINETLRKQLKLIYPNA